MGQSFERTSRIKPAAASRAKRLRGAVTFTERLLWEDLRKLDAHFRCQRPIGPYVVDFACDPAKLVIEIDGGIHRFADVKLRDAQKQAWLEAEGYRVLRFTDKDVAGDRDAVIANITAALTAPFPLEGGRAGVKGVHADGSVGSMEAKPSSQTALPLASSAPASARTPPTQPFPPRGGRA